MRAVYLSVEIHFFFFSLGNTRSTQTPLRERLCRGTFGVARAPARVGLRSPGGRGGLCRCPLSAFCFCSSQELGYSWPFAVSHEFWNLLGKRDFARKIREWSKAHPDRRSDSIQFSMGVAPL